VGEAFIDHRKDSATFADDDRARGIRSLGGIILEAPALGQGPGRELGDVEAGEIQCCTHVE